MQCIDFIDRWREEICLETNLSQAPRQNCRPAMVFVGKMRELAEIRFGRSPLGQMACFAAPAVRLTGFSGRKRLKSWFCLF